MKLSYYGWAAVASLMLLPACSNEEQAAENNVQEEAVFVPGDSEFEISLSYGNQTDVSVDKRAVVNNVTDMNEVGVFCLARGKQNVNQAAPDIDWSSNAPLSTCVLMRNVKAEVSDEDGNLSWSDHYFYPISQFYAYGLYGYYPYVEDANVRYESGKVYVRQTIDGTQDLIWGRASEHDSNSSAYSATFFRQSSAYSAYVPVLDMKHMLTRLEFYVQPGETYSGSGVVFEGAENMVVESISILDAINKLDMLVADLSRPNMEKAEVVGDELQPKQTFDLKDETGNPIEPVAVGTVLGQETKVGESIMLVPSSHYLLRIVLKDVEKGMSFVTEYPLTLTSSDSGAKFQSGMSYKVTIRANKPKEVTLKAKVDKWPQAAQNPPAIIL